MARAAALIAAAALAAAGAARIPSKQTNNGAPAAAAAAAGPRDGLLRTFAAHYPAPAAAAALRAERGLGAPFWRALEGVRTELASAAALEQRLSRMNIRSGVGAAKGGRRVKTTQATPGHSYFPDGNDGFYAVVPEYLGAAVPGGAPFTWSSACAGSNMAVATWVGGGNAAVSVNVTSSAINASAPGCSDFYLLGTVDGLQLVSVDAAGSQVVSLDVSRATWVGREGVRVFRFMHDAVTTVGDALATVSLFIPSLTEAVLDANSQALNLKFLADYVNITMEPRGVDLIDMDWSVVNTGDMLIIQRLDGLGTMEQWGTGATTTHVTMAVRQGSDNRLFVAESTAKDAYWPLDNIQMNAIETWLPMAQAAAYAVVHLPLSDAARAALNVPAALAFIANSLGLPYGYHNFIATFFDTLTGNLPWPASWQFVEVAFNWLEGLDRALTDQLLADSLNMRLGTVNLTLAECADTAWATQGVSIGQLMAQPEQDTWVYADGPSMVCDVFYCNILKAGGLFSTMWGIADDDLNCREFHNLDVYRLAIYNTTAPRPAACVAADPTLPTCQIMGQYRLHLPFVNTMTPYALMNQNCTALPLSYTRVPYNC